jgi:Ca2+/H+ antiporter, TMEM165/GDT1 family
METPNQNFCKRKKCLFIPLLIIGVFAISGIVMYLWNHLLPNIFTLPLITYWQSMGLLILSRILFGGWSYQRHLDHVGHPHHQAFKDKLMEMSEDEKLKFKSIWKNRCCK